MKANVRLENCIFRFLKLPIELRYMIYRVVMVASKSLSKSALLQKNPIINGFALMQTSKAVYAEAKPFYYKNTFSIDDVRNPILKPSLPPLRQNMTSMSFKWPNSNKSRDAAFMNFVNSCESLTTLTIVITHHGFSRGSHSSLPNTLHQDDPAVPEFSRYCGFDSLVSVRGLKQVKVDATEMLEHEPLYRFSHPGPAVDAEKIQALEDFLNRVLTQSKPETQVNKAVSHMKRVMRKSSFILGQ